MSEATSFIRILGQILEQLKKLPRLPDEEPISRKRLHRTHGSALRVRRANDRTRRKVTAKKNCRLGHDEIGLELFPAKRRRIKIWESDRYPGYRIDHIRQLNRISGLVLPSLEVANLSATDAEYDA